MKLLLFALAAAALMKKSNPGIGKVTTPNPAVQFFYNGIKINGVLIPGSWYKDSDGVHFNRRDYGYEDDKWLAKYFTISNETDSMTDYYEHTTIFFNEIDNANYYPYARKIEHEASGKKELAFNKWLNELEVTIFTNNGIRYATISKNGKELGILSENPYNFRIWSEKTKMYKLKKFVEEIGFDNAFAAYL